MTQFLFMAESFFEFRERLTRKPAVDDVAPAGRSEPLSVTELTGQIERVVKAGFPRILYVKGEVSNYRLHGGSGHVYFTLKDAENCIDAVMWKSSAARLKFEPQDGMEVLVSGHVAIYGARGRYQLYASTISPLGKGALEVAFRQLCAKLEAEGLFEARRKKPLPRYPMSIALVTSQGTAALADMAKVLRRFAWVRVCLVHVPVQGDGAAARIAVALGEISRRRECEVILLARGGGSLEDLWAFNEEVVARAVAGSLVPIITGIGHETDVSIADLAADYHAHTPTEAAQVVTQHWRTVEDELAGIAGRMGRAVSGLVAEARHRLRGIIRHEAFRRPLDRVNVLRQVLDDRQQALLLGMVSGVARRREELREVEERVERQRPSRKLAELREELAVLDQRLGQGMGRRLRVEGDVVARGERRLAARHPGHGVRLERQRLSVAAERLRCGMSLGRQRIGDKVDALARQLEALSPEAVLRRGFSLTTIKKSGVVVRSAGQIVGGERLMTRLGDGQIESTAEDPRQARLFE